MIRLRLLSATLGCALALIALSAPLAQAYTPITSFSTVPASPQAGGHPNVAFNFNLENRLNPGSFTEGAIDPCDCKRDARNIVVHLPTGLVANPHATPQCTIALFSGDTCPVDSQVGIIVFSVSSGPEGAGSEGAFTIAPVYNLVPPPDEPGLLGFKSGLLDTPTFTVVSARTGSDYGVDASITNIDHFAPLLVTKEILWGVPAESRNDFLRFELGEEPLIALSYPFCDVNFKETEDPSAVFQLCQFVGLKGGGPVGGQFGSGEQHPIASNSPLTPFWQSPTTCGGSSLATSLAILSYDGGTSHADSAWPATTGCDQLSFNPSQSIAPTTEEADAASGAELRLTVPQFESPTVPSPSELREAVVTLPPGFALAPNVMNGKTTCSDAEARLGTTEEAHCPENAKVGTISVETPVLPGPLNGAVYLGEPKPGNRFRLILTFDGFGVHIKLPGTITPDPSTGQIHVSFKDLPQQPFADFNMHIFGSERGPLATPTRCGTYEVTSEFTPWDSALPTQTSRQFFHVTQGPHGSPCPSGPRPFSPAVRASSVSNTAGAHSPFWIDVTREDGEQNLTGLTVATPPGFAATLKGVPYCPQAAIDRLADPLYSGIAELGSSACPPASQIGTVSAGVGAGSHPLYLPGKVYLAGPYKGAPLSLVVDIPAVSGPYDLGTVAVRAALHIDPATAQVTTVSDPFPQIVGGIPIRARRIFVNLDRPGFTLNPTNCEPLSVNATMSGDEGGTSSTAAHYQIANCAALPFSPKLSLRLAGSTKQAGNPALTATVTAKPGEANISRTHVTLPRTELVDNAHINTPCTRVQFAEGSAPGEKCPRGSILGSARAETPLLAKPLEGPIYLRSTGRAGLPDVVAALNGQIDIALDGHVDSVGGRLATTFETVPDAPVTGVVLSFYGGHKSLLENSPGVCTHTLHVTAVVTGQNGKTTNQNPILGTPCANKHKRKARVHRNRRAAR